MKKVILIGGSPMTGKSTVAIELAAQLRYPCVSTDDIGEALQTVVPINPMRGQDFRDYYANKPQESLLTDIREYHAAIEPAVLRLIEIHSTWGSPLVLEGWALYPKNVQPHLNDTVSACWLIAGEGLLTSRLAQKSDFLEGKAAQNYLYRSQWHNAVLLEQCKELNLPYLVVNGEQSPEQWAEELLRIANIE